MAKTKKHRLLRYLCNTLTIAFHVILAALVLYICLAGFFPAATYWSYLLPAFGLLFVNAAGTDISLMKINVDRYYNEKE